MMKSLMEKRIRLFAMLIAVMASMILIGAAAPDVFASAEWSRFQNSEENNGVTPVEMPPSYNEAALKWNRQMVEGYTTSFTPPLIIDGYLYTASNSKVYKINRETGDIIAESAEMQVNVSYAMHPMTYCEEKGYLFLPLLNGRVQCIKASDLSLVWISKTYTGTQALSPITYKDGLVYTGIWGSETTDGVYFALNADTGRTVWEFRPSELTTETTAKDLGNFKKPTGASTPDNFYTYTALITVKAKDGYRFATDKYGKYWLYKTDGTKVIPEGQSEDTIVQSTVNGRSTTFEVDPGDPSTAVIRARFDCYNKAFGQEGGDGQVSSVEITGLDVPAVGSTLDTSASTTSPVTVQGVTWKTGDIPHGFYWDGPYVNDRCVVFGSDDGQNNTFGEAGSDTYTDTSVLYSVNRTTGALIDKIEACVGDIRSTVVYHNGYVYFTSKGGRLYKVKLNSDGTFDRNTLSFVRTNGMMTASPVIYNGRIYVGVSGTGGQFNADGGHLFAVIRDDEKLSGSYDSNKPGEYSGSFIYTTQIAGYPQASPLLSSGSTDGKVRLYFTFNAFPGGIYYLEDSEASTGTSHSEAALLFKPEQAMRQYCISPLCVDSNGTIYLKNDSGYLMAVAVNKAYLPAYNKNTGHFGIKVTAGDQELKWSEPFESGTLNYTLKAPNGVTQADVQLEVPDGMTAAINGEQYKGGKVAVPVAEDSSAVTVTVSRNVLGKLYNRTYTLNMSAANNNANLAGLAITDSNSAPSFIVDTGAQHTNTIGLGFDPVFNAGTQKYVSRAYDGTRTFINIWVKTEDPNAKVKAYPVDSVGNALAYTNDDGTIPNKGSGGNIRFPVYWIKGRISAEIKLVVTPESGKEEAQKEYNVELVRTENHLDIGNDVLTLSVSSATLYTSGGNRTIQARAFYGEKDVTTDCRWYSSKPDIATVDANGNIAAQNKPGDAMIWASYGAQNTEDRPISVKVRKAPCAAPIAGLAPGTYDSVKKVKLTTATAGADIYYNVGEISSAVAKPDENSTKYTGPITLGEPGALKKYRIRAIAMKDDMSPSETADFEYVIDLRKKIVKAEIAGLYAPEEGKVLGTDIAASSVKAFDNTGAVPAGTLRCSGIAWYKLTSDGKEEPAGNIAEADTYYRAVLILSSGNEDTYALSKSMLVNAGGIYMTAEDLGDGTIRAAADFVPAGGAASQACIVGVELPRGGSAFSSSAFISTNAVRITRAEWILADGSAAPATATYNAEYALRLVLAAGEGYSIADGFRVSLNHDGTTEAIAVEDVKKNEDGTYEVLLRFTASKLRIDSTAENPVIAEGSVEDFDNGTPIDSIIGALRAAIRVSVKAEDGSEVAISPENIYWDGEEMSRAYDPDAVSAASFNAIGRVTLPDYMDADGSSLIVTVPVSVKQGVVAAPVISPEEGTYREAQTVSFTCETKGAAIMFTRSDKEGTFTFEEPFEIAGVPEEKTTYSFKAFAMVNGIKSETVSFTIVIDFSPEIPDPADAAAHSLNSITPDEEAAQAAAENKAAGTVKDIKFTGNVKKKRMTISFRKVKGALNYRVEYRQAKSKAWYYVWTKGKTKVAIGRLKKGGAYEFRIAPYRITDGKWERGPWSASQYQFLQTTKAKIRAGRKSAVATVGKVKKCTGYQVRYSLKKNMKKAKTKTFKGWKKTKLTVKKLKKGKKYFIQVCPYRKVGGKIYTGVWTKVKKVKVK